MMVHARKPGRWCLGSVVIGHSKDDNFSTQKRATEGAYSVARRTFSCGMKAVLLVHYGRTGQKPVGVPRGPNNVGDILRREQGRHGARAD